MNRMKNCVFLVRKWSYTTFNIVNIRKMWERTRSMTKKRSSEIFTLKMEIFPEIGPRKNFWSRQIRRQVSAHVNCGVPQGSNLGPLLFILYINDLANISPALYFILFADDTNVFYSHASWGELVRIINEELLKINDWFLANKLSLNLDKTNYILFKSHRKPAPKDNPGIKIQDLLLNQVLRYSCGSASYMEKAHKRNLYENCQEYWSYTSYCPSVASVYQA